MVVTLKEIKDVIRQPYAFPGGYPLYGITDDSCPLCTDCMKDEFRNIAYATMTDQRNGWQIMAIVINYEDNDLYCDHCDNKIHPAYEEC